MDTLPKRVRITVTEDDIAKGKRGNMLFCPVARAIKGRFPEMGVVTQERFTELKSTYLILYRHSLSLKRFIVGFDTESLVEPASFILTMTSRSELLDGRG